MISVRNHKNCSKERPPATMQASHRWRALRTLVNTPDTSKNHLNQVFIGVDEAYVNKTLHVASDKEVLSGKIRQMSRWEPLPEQSPGLHYIPIHKAVNEIHTGHFLIVKLVIPSGVKDDRYSGYP